MRGHLTQTYLIALGSNIRHVRFGGPCAILSSALEEIGRRAITVEAVSPIISSAPVGPSQRRFANAVARISTMHGPGALLGELQAIEHRFGRRDRGGQRWRARVLDLDIVLWSGGTWASPDLLIPHPAFRQRDFVLGPAAGIAPEWRDPLSGLSLRQLHARLTRPKRLPR